MTTYITLTQSAEEDSYKVEYYDILSDGEVVGDCNIMVSDTGAYCERIDIKDEHQNKGHGTAALNLLSDMYNGVMVAPDNKDSARLFERIGNDVSDSNSAYYYDQGYGVYSI